MTEQEIEQELVVVRDYIVSTKRPGPDCNCCDALAALLRIEKLLKGAADATHPVQA